MSLQKGSDQVVLRKERVIFGQKIYVVRVLGK